MRRDREGAGGAQTRPEGRASLLQPPRPSDGTPDPIHSEEWGRMRGKGKRRPWWPQEAACQVQRTKHPSGSRTVPAGGPTTLARAPRPNPLLGSGSEKRREKEARTPTGPEPGASCRVRWAEHPSRCRTGPAQEAARGATPGRTPDPTHRGMCGVPDPLPFQALYEPRRPGGGMQGGPLGSAARQAASAPPARGPDPGSPRAPHPGARRSPQAGARSPVLPARSASAQPYRVGRRRRGGGGAGGGGLSERRARAGGGRAAGEAECARRRRPPIGCCARGFGAGGAEARGAPRAGGGTWTGRGVGGAPRGTGQVRKLRLHGREPLPARGPWARFLTLETLFSHLKNGPTHVAPKPLRALSTVPRSCWPFTAIAPYNPQSTPINS